MMNTQKSIEKQKNKQLEAFLVGGTDSLSSNGEKGEEDIIDTQNKSSAFENRKRVEQLAKSVGRSKVAMKLKN